MASFIVYRSDMNIRIEDEIMRRHHSCYDGYLICLSQRPLPSAVMFILVLPDGPLPDSLEEHLLRVSSIPIAVVGPNGQKRLPLHRFAESGAVQFWCDDAEALLKVIDDRWPTSKEKSPVVED